MKNQLKDQQQFILDTLLPYKLDSSICAIEDKVCSYNMTDGRKCAIGKHMKKGEWQNLASSVSMLMRKYRNMLDEVFTKEFMSYRFSVEVLSAMQQYHDNVASGDIGNVNYYLTELEKHSGIEFPELRYMV